MTTRVTAGRVTFRLMARRMARRMTTRATAGRVTFRLMDGEKDDYQGDGG